MTSGSIITRDLYKTYVNQNISWEKERAVARIIMMLIFLASLYIATFAKPAMVIFSGMAISIAFQFLIVLLGLIWFPWITRGAAIYGLIIGIIIVILTETIGQQITGNRLPWGRWPLTIHSGVWGLLFNVFVCFSISAFSNITKIDIYRSHRQKFHDFLNEHMGLHPSRTKLRSFAYVIVLIWLFFGIGPGQIIGNSFFGEPGAGYEAWILKIPSIWGYQLIWWFIGIGIIWFLASKMDLSTLPNKPILANDLYKKIINACDIIINEQKVTRKPRAVKAKRADDVIKKLKFQLSDVSYEITSVPPVDIVGSVLTVIFNTKTRKIGLYVAEDSSGLSVKGTTIYGYNEDTSIQKTLRKPKNQLKLFNVAKTKLVKEFESLKTADTKLNGRTNEHCIILRCFK